MKNVIYVPIDVLPIHDRINLRQNYLRAVIDGREEKLSDPFLPLLEKENFTPVKIDVPTYLTPFPEKEDLPLITLENYISFFRENGFYHLAEKVQEAVLNVERPFLTISPDHSVTYGVLKALKSKGIKPLILIFDAHLDVVSPDLPMENLTAGNFIRYIYDEGFKEIVVAGIVDDPELNREIYDTIPQLIKDEYPVWKNRIKILNYMEMKNYKKFFKDLIKKWKEKEIYISIDIDVASGKDLWGVRFFEGRGIGQGTLLEILRFIKDVSKEENKRISGIDFTEWDPLLMNITLRGKKDKVFDTFREIIKIFF